MIPVFPLIWLIGLAGIVALVMFLFRKIRERRAAVRGVDQEPLPDMNPLDERILSRIHRGVI